MTPLCVQQLPSLRHPEPMLNSPYRSRGGQWKERDRVLLMDVCTDRHCVGSFRAIFQSGAKKLFPLCVREVCALALYSDCWHCPPLEHADSPFDILSTVRGNRPGKPVQLQEYEIKYLCTKAREIFITQPILLELEAPIKICGMAHENVAIMSLATLDAFSRR